MKSYKWDFCTRLVGIGIWDDVYADITGNGVITSRHGVFDGSSYTDTVETDGADGMTLHGTLSFDGVTVGECSAVVKDGRAVLSVTADHPHLWFPNGWGEQPLYDWKLTLSDGGTVSDERTAKVGLRTLTYERCDGADETALPYLPVVNGKRIFIKGINMTPLDMMYGCVEDTRYEKLLKLAKDANVDLIRVWGGGNELMDRHNVPSTYEDENIALLKSLCEKYDPDYRDAMKPYHISMRYDKLVRDAGETFSGTLFLLDDEAGKAPSTLRAIVTDQDGRELCVSEREVSFVIPAGTRYFTVTCTAEDGERNDTNTYLFFVRGEGRPDADADAVCALTAAYLRAVGHLTELPVSLQMKMKSTGLFSMMKEKSSVLFCRSSFTSGSARRSRRPAYRSRKTRHSKCFRL